MGGGDAAAGENNGFGDGDDHRSTGNNNDVDGTTGIRMQDSPSVRALRRNNKAPQQRRKHPWELEAEDLKLGDVIGAGSNGKVSE